MNYQLEQAIPLLMRTPEALDALLRDLPEAWTSRNEGDNTWSTVEVVGHLIHAERTDWMPRVRMVLEFGESQTFPPFDRLGPVEEKPLAYLLEEFARLRSENVAELRGLHLGPRGACAPRAASCPRRRLPVGIAGYVGSA
jgi:DinB superfamily